MMIHGDLAETLVEFAMLLYHQLTTGHRPFHYHTTEFGFQPIVEFALNITRSKRVRRCDLWLVGSLEPANHNAERSIISIALNVKWTCTKALDCLFPKNRSRCNILSPMCGILVSSGTYSIQEIYLNVPVEHYTHVSIWYKGGQWRSFTTQYIRTCVPSMSQPSHTSALCSMARNPLSPRCSVIVGMPQYPWHSQPGVFQGILV